MAQDKSKRRNNFAARQRRIAERARSKMLLAGIPTRSPHCDGEGSHLSPEQIKPAGGVDEKLTLLHISGRPNKDEVRGVFLSFQPNPFLAVGEHSCI